MHEFASQVSEFIDINDQKVKTKKTSIDYDDGQSRLLESQRHVK